MWFFKPKTIHIYVTINNPNTGDIMAAFEDLTAKVDAAKNVLDATKLEVARVADLIASEREGGLSAEQAAAVGLSLDEANAKLAEVKDAVAAIN